MVQSHGLLLGLHSRSVALFQCSSDLHLLLSPSLDTIIPREPTIITNKKIMNKKQICLFI